MGCDIHLYTERKREDPDGNEFWWCCDNFKPNVYALWDDNEDKYTVNHIYEDRSYELFTALAGVRNSSDVDVIDYPRGLPDDVSDIVKKESDYWGVDGHSHSWLTARELFVYQETHPCTTYSGLVDRETARKLDEDGITPLFWCRWTNSPDYERRTWTVQRSIVEQLVNAVKKRMAEEFWIFDFLDEEEREKRLLEHADDFRIVFWFDN